MNITRETRRADGLTVGQAMDNDAVFLRSVGIPAKDGQPTMDERAESYKGALRAAVLDALDLASKDALQVEKGWIDGELPALFKALDKHADFVLERTGFKNKAKLKEENK